VSTISQAQLKDLQCETAITRKPTMTSSSQGKKSRANLRASSEQRSPF